MSQLTDAVWYQEMYNQSISNPEKFWDESARRYLDWFRPWDTVVQGDLAHPPVSWFIGGQLNPCYNCLDRHLPLRSQQTAIIWEGDEPTQTQRLTYQELFAQVCRFANVLKTYRVSKGDRVCIYLPTIPEAVIAMLACARIGAVHSVVFGGFSPEALQNRIEDAGCTTVITADAAFRGQKLIPLKANVDQALAACPQVQQVIVVNHAGVQIDWHPHRDIDYAAAMQQAAPDCPAEPLSATDPLFILYTSGSTGKPKGILHAIGGYLLYATMTFQTVFNYQPGDIYWCSADVGWITGHSYLVYGPLASGATTLLFSGIPTYPDAARFWQIIDKYQVNIFYTAPTAIRTLMRLGDEPVKSTSRRSLKRLGTVGEPINPDVWQWYYQVIGEGRCPVVDTWWQTETGGIMITPLPGATELKPGSAGLPFFGVVPVLVDEQGRTISGEGSGKLLLAQPWPGLMQTIYGHFTRFQQGYLAPYPGYYTTGDGAHRDKDGYYWITGRIDDVLNISGHRIGTAEVESALVAHPQVAEAAVVGCPHEIKGEAIYAFVTPLAEVEPSEALRRELVGLVREKIGGMATPEYIQWTNELPKTRSGKIMRRLLRKIVHSEIENLGDTSTLANPAIIDDLIKNKLI